jgi:hypothetical protein
MLPGFALCKGSRRHGVAANASLFAMRCLSASGVYLGIMKSQPGNIPGGTLTFYLVATAGATPEAGTTASAVAVFHVTFRFEAAMSPTGLKHDHPPGPYFFLGSAVQLAPRLRA